MRANQMRTSRAKARGPSRLAGAVEHPKNVVLPGHSPVLVVDRDLAIHSWNEPAAVLFGPLQLATCHIGKLELGPSFSRHIEKAFAQSAPQSLRLAFAKQSFETTVSPLCHSSGAMMLLSFQARADSAAGLKRAGRQASLEASYAVAALDSLSAHIAVLDHDGVILSVNRQWRQRKHGSKAPTADLRTVGANYLAFCAACVGICGATGQIIDGIRAVLQGKQDSFATNYSYKSEDGTRQWFKLAVTALENRPGRRGAVVTHIDLTDQVKLSEQKARQVAALDSAANSIFITDADGRIDWANEAFFRARGYQAAEAEGLLPEIAPHQAGGPDLLARLDSCKKSGLGWSGEVKLNGPSGGGALTVEQTVTPIHSTLGEITHFVIAQVDMTHHRETQIRMMYIAEHDDLTGLLNRKSFDDRLRLAIAQHHSTERPLAVLLVDLDRFKDANETMGHGAGDSILSEAARRMNEALGDGGLAARFGGDEFVMLLSNCGGRDQVRQSAERLLACYRQPFQLEGSSVSIGASIGIALFPADAVTQEELLRAADLALYRAKAEGRRALRFFDRALEAEVSERVTIERELQDSLGTRDLWIAYQPQWDIQSGRITGAESLLRWNPAIRRGISMGRIVSIAEECGLILPIGQWVIKKALTQLRTWQQRFGPDFTMSINLSAVQLNQQDVSALFHHAIGSLGIRPATLKVEITESVLAQNSARVLGAINALVKAGVGLALDDFGTGYSSLTYLQQFPIESVKIDTSFVKEIGRRTQDDAIVKGIVQLAHSLGQTAVAEGVETGEQLAFLRAAGCDSAQGYLISPALPPAEFERFLIAYRNSAHSASVA